MIHSPREMFPWYRIIWNLLTAPLVIISVVLLFVATWIHKFSFEEAKETFWRSW